MEKIRKDYNHIAPLGPTYSRAVRAGDLLFITGNTAPRLLDPGVSPTILRSGWVIDGAVDVNSVLARGAT